VVHQFNGLTYLFVKWYVSGQIAFLGFATTAMLEVDRLLHGSAWLCDLETENSMSSMSRKPSEIEPWLLLSVNRKSQAAYHLPTLTISPNCRKGPRWPSLGHIVSPPLLWYRLLLRPSPGGMRSIVISVSVCLSVCSLAPISQKPHVPVSRNFLYILPMAVDQFFFDAQGVMYSGFKGDIFFPHNWSYFAFVVVTGCLTALYSFERIQFILMLPLHIRQYQLQCGCNAVNTSAYFFANCFLPSQQSWN